MNRQEGISQSKGWLVIYHYPKVLVDLDGGNLSLMYSDITGWAGKENKKLSFRDIQLKRSLIQAAMLARHAVIQVETGIVRREGQVHLDVFGIVVAEEVM